jgi:hypothetical protein
MVFFLVGVGNRRRPADLGSEAPLLAPVRLPTDRSGPSARSPTPPDHLVALA